MPVLTSERKKPKRSKIRYAEYYDLQKTLDSLYADSLKGKVFVHLMELISSEENIRMAYRTIKGNTGSSTAGVDKRTIQDLAKLNEEKYVALIQKQFKSYHPRPQGGNPKTKRENPPPWNPDHCRPHSAAMCPASLGANL